MKCPNLCRNVFFVDVGTFYVGRFDVGIYFVGTFYVGTGLMGFITGRKWAYHGPSMGFKTGRNGLLIERFMSERFLSECLMSEYFLSEYLMSERAS